MRRTHALVQVALVLMSEQASAHWGYDLSRRARVRSGVLYPLLQRLLDAGWLTDGWEPVENDRQRRRRYYEMTDLGRRELGAVLADAALDVRFAPLFGSS